MRCHKKKGRKTAMDERTPKILIVDDEQEWLDILALAFADERWEVLSAASAVEAAAVLNENIFDLVLCDMSMPGMSGIDLLKKLRSEGCETPFIIMTGVGTIRTAVEAMQFGAYNYITKPFRTAEVAALVRKALDEQSLRQSLESDPEEKECENGGFVLGGSAVVTNILSMLRRVASSQAPVLIEGETGTGKSVLARHIHGISRRRGEFFTIDCSSLAENLLESELFGHVKGAFTGAVATRRGLLEQARGGTVFLDEIGELGLNLQAKLLRAIQEKEIRPVGGNTPVRIDTRFIFATNKDLKQCVAEGSFRRDLYYRLAVIAVTLPPLRERREDLPVFISHFVRRFNRGYGREITGISPAAMQILLEQPWPGNIRELENALERAVLLTEGKTITPSALGALCDTAVPAAPDARSGGGAAEEPQVIRLQQAVADAERKAILMALTVANGNRTEAAQLLGIGRRTLYHKLEEYGIGQD